MSNNSAPSDPKKYTVMVFISFAVVFVFAMIMMLMHGSVEYNNGERHYQTEIKEP